MKGPLMSAPRLTAEVLTGLRIALQACHTPSRNCRGPGQSCPDCDSLVAALHWLKATDTYRQARDRPALLPLNATIPH